MMDTIPSFSIRGILIVVNLDTRPSTMRCLLVAVAMNCVMCAKASIVLRRTCWLCSFTMSISSMITSLFLQVALLLQKVRTSFRKKFIPFSLTLLMERISRSATPIVRPIALAILVFPVPRGPTRRVFSLDLVPTAAKVR